MCETEAEQKNGANIRRRAEDEQAEAVAQVVALNAARAYFSAVEEVDALIPISGDFAALAVTAWELSPEALRAGEEMATIRGDDAASRYRALFDKGSAWMGERLWNGEYFVQMNGPEIGTGCFSDQLLGQWWAHLLGLGYLLPPERVRAALHAIYRYTWLPTHESFRHRQRVFADGKDKGLLVCSWPKGGRPARPILLTRADRERIAYHEGGHAILGLVVPGADPVHRVTIVPRGQALGVTYQRPDSDRYNYPESYLRARIVGMLGGRAAEEIVYGTRTTGAESDIEQATALARRMVTRWGMSDDIGMVQLAPRENPYLSGPEGYGGAKPFSERTAERIDAEVQRIIDESHAEARRLLSEHRKSLDALASALLERETLGEDEILDVTGLPPAFLAIAELDVLAEQSIALAAKLRAAAVPAHSTLYSGASHSFLEAVSIAAVSDRALAETSQWLRRQLR